MLFTITIKKVYLSYCLIGLRLNVPISDDSNKMIQMALFELFIVKAYF